MNYPELRKAGIPHCQRCGSLENLNKQPDSSNGAKNFLCTQCNTARCKEWRHRTGNMKMMVANAKRYAEKNKARAKAWTKVQESKVGKRPCQVCGKDKPIHAHHPEPSRALLLVFLCPKHHKQVHLGRISCPEAFDFSPKQE